MLIKTFLKKKNQSILSIVVIMLMMLEFTSLRASSSEKKSEAKGSTNFFCLTRLDFYYDLLDNHIRHRSLTSSKLLTEDHKNELLQLIAELESTNHTKAKETFRQLAHRLHQIGEEQFLQQLGSVIFSLQHLEADKDKIVAESLDPLDLYDYFWYAGSLGASGDISQAVSYLEKIEEILQRFPNPYYGIPQQLRHQIPLKRASFAFRKELYAQVLEILDEAMPRMQQAHLNLQVEKMRCSVVKNVETLSGDKCGKIEWTIQDNEKESAYMLQEKAHALIKLARFKEAREILLSEENKSIFSHLHVNYERRLLYLAEIEISEKKCKQAMQYLTRYQGTESIRFATNRELYNLLWKQCQ